MRRLIGQLLIVLTAAVALLGILPQGATAADPPIVLYATQEDNGIVWFRKSSPPYGSWQGPKLVTDTSMQSYFKEFDKFNSFFVTPKANPAYKTLIENSILI